MVVEPHSNRPRQDGRSRAARIRAAYLDLCERQVRALQHEISVEKALHEDDTIQDLERQAARLASQIAAKKAAMKFPG